VTLKMRMKNLRSDKRKKYVDLFVHVHDGP